jgi:hypothetical protein
MAGVTIAVAALAAAACLVASLAFAGRRGLLRARRHASRRHGSRRILVPFSGPLDETVLDAAIRVAHAEEGVLVAAYLLVVPLQYAEDSPRTEQVAGALPVLEAVEHAALRAGVAVDARIEKGRSLTHALRRLWEVETFDRIVAPAPAGRSGAGFSAKQLAWILTNAPAETIVLRPGPERLAA